MAEINKTQLSDLSHKNIKWVITVPAIWTDVAKVMRNVKYFIQARDNNFLQGAMRKAALTAGLIDEASSYCLQLALEPETACVACEEENENLKKGDSFMVLDCGGGTVDITMHRVASKQPQLLLDELAPPTGGPFGSTFVDIEFENFLRDLVGADAFGRFKPSGSGFSSCAHGRR
jgi:molecular chaperone DnaK (HSP70)